MGRIIFLGTASSIPSPGRDTTALLYIRKNDFFLIDCPGSVPHKLFRCRIDYTKIRDIILTHQHPDHVYGLFHLLHALTRRASAVRVYCNKQTQALVRRGLTIFSLDRPGCVKVVFKDVFASRFFYTRGTLRMQAVKNRHCKGSFGIKCIAGKRKFLYSSDTALSTDIMHHARDVDVLIHDCTGHSSFFQKHPSLYKMHTDSATLAKSFSSFGIKKLVPVHFLIRAKADMKNIRRELAVFGRRLLIPHDFLSLTV